MANPDLVEVFIMQNDTEKQILNELRNINNSLEHMNNKIDTLEKEGKPGSIIWDVMRSLLIGVVIVGPAIAVAMIVFQIIYSWLLG